MKIKYLNKKAGISYLQILILITSIFSFSYFLYLNSVNAQEISGNVCCEETKSGDICKYTSS